MHSVCQGGGIRRFESAMTDGKTYSGHSGTAPGRADQAHGTMIVSDPWTWSDRGSERGCCTAEPACCRRGVTYTVPASRLSVVWRYVPDAASVMISSPVAGRWLAGPSMLRLGRAGAPQGSACRAKCARRWLDGSI